MRDTSTSERRKWAKGKSLIDEARQPSSEPKMIYNCRVDGVVKDKKEMQRLLSLKGTTIAASIKSSGEKDPLLVVRVDMKMTADRKLAAFLIVTPHENPPPFVFLSDYVHFESVEEVKSDPRVPPAETIIPNFVEPKSYRILDLLMTDGVWYEVIECKDELDKVTYMKRNVSSGFVCYRDSVDELPDHINYELT